MHEVESKPMWVTHRLKTRGRPSDIFGSKLFWISLILLGQEKIISKSDNSGLKPTHQN